MSVIIQYTQRDYMYTYTISTTTYYDIYITFYCNNYSTFDISQRLALASVVKGTSYFL
jgi:hypothetical protein